MIKRPKPSDTEEDIMRMEQEFLTQCAKNPQTRPAAQLIKVQKRPKKSLFVQSRETAHLSEKEIPPMTLPVTTSTPNLNKTKQLLNDLQEKIACDLSGNKNKPNMADIILGDIVENTFSEEEGDDIKNYGTEKLLNTQLHSTSASGNSIFARTFKAVNNLSTDLISNQQMDAKSEAHTNLNGVYGNESVIVNDINIAKEVHKQNIELLSQMPKEEILAERQKLLNSIDPTLVKLLYKKRQSKAQELSESLPRKLPTIQPPEPTITGQHTDFVLDETNPVYDLVKRSTEEKWLNFDVVEKDKLAWMHDIPAMAKKLKPGEKFEARFDWKGILLPYSLDDIRKPDDAKKVEGDRILYLHGEEPNRPGYTLQELFRLARSDILQQRISAFGAMAGILNIYNQGFYDQVLELPISKIFFLLRLGLDNTPAQIEIVVKALAYLFYNETDEILLDYVFDNAGCHWQPVLTVLENASDADDPTSIENLQKQMRLLQLNSASITATIEENEETDKSSMTDFQLAETDLMECFLRTNILQRIYFILNTLRPDNSTVSSCLKLLIRLARTNKTLAEQIVNNQELLNCLIVNFIPPMSHVDSSQQLPPYYNYPQYLCLKLMRVLISYDLKLALQLGNTTLLNTIKVYLYNREDMGNHFIKVQIESLRILRTLLLQQAVEKHSFKEFLPALRQILDWHYNHCVYEVGGSTLIRQHAAALLATIAASGASGFGDLEVQRLLGETLHDCCCSWLYKATRVEGIKEYSQVTLLAACLYVLTWYGRPCLDVTRLHNFTTKYLPDFLRSENFIDCLRNLKNASILLRNWTDRRNVHPALPNLGAVLMNHYGPQLIMTQTYSVQFLNAIWSFLEVQLDNSEKALIQLSIVEHLVGYLKALQTSINRYLATNFFARSELKLIYKLLCVKGLDVYFKKSELLQLVYQYVCCLPVSQSELIISLFELYIFNVDYVNVEADVLKKWYQICLKLIFRPLTMLNTEKTLTVSHMEVPILPADWPYFQLGIMLKNYIDNVQQKSAVTFSEREVIQMTLNFTTVLEMNGMQIVTPTEKLMYIMIAFMGPDSQFLAADMQEFLSKHIIQFYKANAMHTFDFDAVYANKCKYENLYALFVEQFQAVSYGNELFGSLVLLPLAQKYDNKWRRRLWSDYASALRFLNCDENLLMGGLSAYLEPVEQEISLIKLYAVAINTKLVREGTVPYKIAKHHLDHFKSTTKNTI